MRERGGMSVSSNEEREALESRIANSPGAIAYNRIRELDVSYGVFVSNYSEMQQLHKAINTPPVCFQLYDPERKDLLESVHKQIQRHFANFLSSAMTLKDHSCIFIRNYDNTELGEEITRKVDLSFRENELHHFIQKLRNYVLHCKMPFATQTLHFGKDILSEMYLSKTSLLEWSGWDVLSTRYINNQSEDISFFFVAFSYHEVVTEFYSWLFPTVTALHQNEIDRTSELIKMRNEMLEKSV